MKKLIYTKKFRYLLLMLLTLFCFSCVKEEFYLNKLHEKHLSGFVLGSLDSIAVTHDNAMTLFSDELVALRQVDITQFTGDFTVELKRGDSLSFSFRTIADHFAQQPKLTYSFTTTGSTVWQNGQMIAQVDSVKLKRNEKYRLKIHNYANYFCITVDCDTVLYSRTNLDLSEFIIIRTFNATEASISGINFDIVDDALKPEDWEER